MKKLVMFCVRVSQSFVRNDLHFFAGDITYKLLLSIFPLLIFGFAVIGFLHIDYTEAASFIEGITGMFPPGVMEIIENFVTEVISTRSGTLVSVSIITALYSSSSGFASMARALSNCNGGGDTRNWVHRRLLGIFLSLLFVGIIVAVMVFLVFSRGFGQMMLSVLTVFIIIILIYKVGSCKKISVVQVVPGACITVIGWMGLSLLFNVYVRNFSNFTVVYGSLGGIFILLVWINMMTMILLWGAEVNAQLQR